jgi:hypothetical protein
MDVMVHTGAPFDHSSTLLLDYLISSNSTISFY